MKIEKPHYAAVLAILLTLLLTVFILTIFDKIRCENHAKFVHDMATFNPSTDKLVEIKEQGRIR